MSRFSVDKNNNLKFNFDGLENLLLKNEETESPETQRPTTPEQPTSTPTTTTPTTTTPTPETQRPTTPEQPTSTPTPTTTTPATQPPATPEPSYNFERTAQPITVSGVTSGQSSQTNTEFEGKIDVDVDVEATYDSSKDDEEKTFFQKIKTPLLIIIGLIVLGVIGYLVYNILSKEDTKMTKNDFNLKEVEAKIIDKKTVENKLMHELRVQFLKDMLLNIENV